MYSPCFLFANKTGTGYSEVVDILGPHKERMPPVLQVHMSSTGTWDLEAAHDPALWNVVKAGVLVGGFYDLIPGIRYWRVNLKANAGVVNAVVGPVSGDGGNVFQPSIVSAGYSAI